MIVRDEIIPRAQTHKSDLYLLCGSNFYFKNHHHCSLKKKCKAIPNDSSISNKTLVPNKKRIQRIIRHTAIITSKLRAQATRKIYYIKMRYKVNFHVLLWFLSSCTTIIMSNQETIHRSNDNNNSNNNEKHHNITAKHMHHTLTANDKNHKTAHNYDESHSASRKHGSPPNDSSEQSNNAGKKLEFSQLLFCTCCVGSICLFFSALLCYLEPVVHGYLIFLGNFMELLIFHYILIFFLEISNCLLLHLFSLLIFHDISFSEKCPPSPCFRHFPRNFFISLNTFIHLPLKHFIFFFSFPPTFQANSCFSSVFFFSRKISIFHAICFHCMEIEFLIYRVEFISPLIVCIFVSALECNPTCNVKPRVFCRIQLENPFSLYYSTAFSLTMDSFVLTGVYGRLQFFTSSIVLLSNELDIVYDYNLSGLVLEKLLN